MTRKTLTLKNPPKIDTLQETALDRQQKCLDFLCKTYPKCFSKKMPRPLKSNILHEIFEDLGEEMPFSKSTLRQTLKVYCHNFKYLSSTLSSRHRIGLDGKEGDQVTQEHLEHAKNQLNKMRTKKS
ncbi:MAG: hypothetical protein GY915_03790 [bacterium]|nr:hypothetical protein [bacterium]